MWFWWVMFICSLIIPTIMIVAGRMMWKHCPKEINVLIGYRTKRSMQNEDTWKFAHYFCGKLWWIIGWTVLVPSAVPLIPFYNGTYETIGIVIAITAAVQISALILSIIPTEVALTKHFIDDGTHR